MSELRDQYFKELGLPSDKLLEAQERALTRAYELRTFEIEHYWRRATYFWGFQVAIFAAFGLLWKDTASNPWNPVAVALAGLGVLTALANWLSALGSKFWQENWEKHIDILEKELEGNLFKIIWLKNGNVSYSVSRLNQSLSFFLVCFWLITSAYVTWRFLYPESLCLDVSGRKWPFAIAFLVAVVAGSWRLLSQKTRLRGTETDSGPFVRRSAEHE